MHWLVEMATVVIGKLQHIYDKAIFLISSCYETSCTPELVLVKSFLSSSPMRMLNT